ncbi:FAD binding domain-containing protein [Rhodococcus sp. NPDC059968]|uniref:FAD binding domain-containing protein n=1 Tax=Rhodococcus sp. NPDC059968 TaxID=3347017 RepID=UPI00366DEC7B
MRLGRPTILVDINRGPGLDTIEKLNDTTVRVGALVRHSMLIEQTHLPLLSEAAKWIGHSAIRTRGTTGGSIAHADPSAELPVVATALGALVHVHGPGGTRTVVADDLFVGPLETSLDENEIVTAVDFPVPERSGFAASPVGTATSVSSPSPWRSSEGSPGSRSAVSAPYPSGPSPPKRSSRTGR